MIIRAQGIILKVILWTKLSFESLPESLDEAPVLCKLVSSRFEFVVA